jgi:hypothetical protein
MKKTITAMAVLASAASAQALIGPRGSRTPTPAPNQFCLQVMTDDDGLQTLEDCDSTRDNARLRRPILANGCAEGQAAMTSFTVEIPSCRHIVQL